MSAAKKRAAKLAPKKLSPRNARTFKRLLALRQDNISTTTHWFLVNERSVSIVAQRSGEHATESVELPRRVFDRFVDWYNAEQETVR